MHKSEVTPIRMRETVSQSAEDTNGSSKKSRRNLTSSYKVPTSTVNVRVKSFDGLSHRWAVGTGHCYVSYENGHYTVHTIL